MSGSSCKMTLGAALARTASKFPEKIAVQDNRVKLTYRTFNQRVNRLANALVGLGLGKGDRIAVLSSNCTGMMELYLGALKTGIIPCPLDVRGILEDQIPHLNLVAPRAFAFQPEQAVRAEEIYSKLSREVLTLAIGSHPDSPFPDTDRLLSKGDDSEPKGKVAEEDTAFVLFTGGTTGTPKGVMLSHKNLLWNAINVIGENGSPNPESIIHYPMQIYHSGALSRFLASLYAGGTFIATGKFDPGDYLHTLAEENCTFAVGNTAIWHLLLEESRKNPRPIQSVTSWLHAQGDIYPELRDEIVARLFPNGRMYASYALTEASPGVTVLKPRDRPRRWPGIGRPYIPVQVRIADDKDQDVPLGEVGQILVKGPNVMSGYYQNEEETRAALAGGWLHTGDLGCADDLGYLYFVDRLKDVIKSGGMNVYGSEVERAIQKHPQVEEVAVIGLPDEKWGEAVTAIIVPRKDGCPTAKDIIDHCRANLASYKKPTAVIFVESLPKGSFGGKVLKRELRKIFKARPGDKEGESPAGRSERRGHSGFGF